MALSFPTSPTVGQIHYSGAKYWYWTGSGWRVNNLVLNSPPDILRVDGQSASDSTAFVVANPSIPSVVEDVKGDLRAQSLTTKNSAYVLQATDHGSIISISTGGVTVPAGQFSPGQSVTVFNNSSGSQTITTTGTTSYLAGSASTGNRTLAQRGLATITCVALDTFVISGSGIT